MTNNNRIFDVLLLLLGWLFIYVDASFVVCVVRRVRRSSFRLSRLVYRLLQFQERLFKDKETLMKDKETPILIFLTAFLSSSSSTFIFL